MIIYSYIIISYFYGEIFFSVLFCCSYPRTANFLFTSGIFLNLSLIGYSINMQK